MKKVKKILLFSVIGVLALAIIAVVVVSLFLGSIVKTGINNAGPRLTQTTLTVDGVDISMLTGSAKVKNLVLGNPEGYKDKSPNAISVGTAAVRVAPMSVLSDKIVVKYIRVEAPEITFIGNPFGQNNLKKIQENVNAGAANYQATNQPAASGAPAKPGKKLEVDEFTITGAKIHFGADITLPLPDIHLGPLGTGPDGITPVELTKDVLGEIANGSIKAVAGSAANLGKGAENLGKQGVNKITSGIGGLFKK